MGIAAQYASEKRELQARLDSTNTELRDLLRTTARSGGSQDSSRLRELRQQVRQLEDDIAVAAGLEQEGAVVDAEEAARARRGSYLEAVDESARVVLAYAEGLGTIDRSLDIIAEQVARLPPLLNGAVQPIMSEVDTDKQREELSNFTEHAGDLYTFVQRRVDEIFGRFQPGVERGFRIEPHVSRRLQRFIDRARDLAPAVSGE